MDVLGGRTDWSRSLSADLFFGDSITTEVCSNCGTGELDTDVNSYGWGDWAYAGPSVDLSSYSGGSLMFNWGADQAGADIRFIFERENVGSFTVSQNNLGQGQPFTPLTYMLDLPTNQDTILEDVTSIEIQVDASGREFDPDRGFDSDAIFDLDANIDNVKLVKDVPEPGTILGLLAVGGLGLGLKRKKEQK